MGTKRSQEILRKLNEQRELAEQDLYYFARLVNPQRLYGDIHKEVFKWLMSDDPTSNQLLLLARGHMKSHMMAVWCAWWITRNPHTTILYISATSDLSEQQLAAIKNILDSDVYRLYWPEMINAEEGKREKWSSTRISVDHPKRKYEGVRDATVRAAGLTTTTAGSHADVIIADDVVVPENAYTEEGRKKTAAAMSQMSSIKNAGGLIKACGTTYHPKDIYSDWKEQEMFIADKESGEILGKRKLWDILERPVEKDGVFIWPRSIRSDGEAYGFDWQILHQIQAEYLDRAQFFAQYYLNPNDPESDRISRDNFQYYNPKYISNRGNSWFYKEDPLNVYAAIDFAYSLSKGADYTAIVVIGVNPDGHIFVLDIDRFKTDKISEYYKHVVTLHARWEFKKLRAEVTAAQEIIVNDLKDNITREGLRLSIEKHRPTRTDGSKEERIAAVLEPRYDNMAVWHFKGGYTPMLEEELVLARPPHDDLKDALACAVEIAIAPRAARFRDKKKTNVVPLHPRFGGGG